MCANEHTDQRAIVVDSSRNMVAMANNQFLPVDKPCWAFLRPQGQTDELIDAEIDIQVLVRWGYILPQLA